MKAIPSSKRLIGRDCWTDKDSPERVWPSSERKIGRDPRPPKVEKPTARIGF